ncbi:MAG: DNA polymerase III subunit delta [Aquificaceae bacterium]|nr:DNA polymerase III subunit delta [Aquificaceae bacterium]
MIGILEYQKKLSKEQPKQVNLLHGEEEYLVKTLVDKLREKYSVSILWGDEISPADLERLLLTGSMFDRRGVLFVYKALDLFKSIKDVKPFISALSRLRDKVVFFYVESKLSDKDLQKEPFLSLSKLGDVISAGKLDKRKIRETVKNKLQKAGINIEEQALDYMLEATSYNLMVLKVETEKLILYGKTHLTLEDIKHLLVADREMSIFDFVDGMLLRDYEKAINSLNSVLRAGMHPLQVLSLFTNYALKLYTAKSLVEEGKSVEESLALVDVKHPFQVMNYKKYLGKNSKQDLWFLIRKLHILDIKMKVFYEDPAQSLRNFVIEYMLNEEGTYYSSDTGDQDRLDLEP